MKRSCGGCRGAPRAVSGSGRAAWATTGQPLLITRHPAHTFVLLLLALALLAGCNKRLALTPTANRPPTVRITSGPVDTNEVCRPRPGISCYSIEMHWVGFDPDGRVAHYLYAIDPPDIGDTTWIAT